MEKLYKEIQEINKLDSVSAEKRLCKLFEESGELAQAVNRSIGRKENSMTEEEVTDLICEEASDTIQCVISLIDTYGISYEDLVKKMSEKNNKWRSKIK